MRRDIKHSHTEITPLRRDKGMKTGLSLVVENNDSPRRTRIPEFYCELVLFIRYLFDITSFVC